MLAPLEERAILARLDTLDRQESWRTARVDRPGPQV